MLTLKGIFIALAATAGLLVASIIAINLWIPKQPIINYINSATGGKAAFDKIVIGWDWGPDVRIDNLVVSGVPLGDSTAELAFAQTRLKISFEAFWRNLTESERLAQPDTQNPPAKNAAESAEHWLVQYFQSLKIIDGRISIADGSRSHQVSSELFEINASDPNLTSIVFAGDVNDLDMTLTAALSGLKTLLDKNSSDFLIEGFVMDKANAVFGEGTIGDIRSFRDIALAVAMDINSPSSLLKHLNIPEHDLNLWPAATLQFNVSIPDGLESFALSSLDLRSNAYGVDIRVFGDPGRALAIDDIHLNLEAGGNLDTADLAPMPGIDGDLNIKISGRISGSLEQLAFVPAEALIQGQGISASLDGRFEIVNGAWNTDGILEAVITREASFVTPKVEFLFPATVRSNLRLQADSFVLDQVRMSSNQEFAKHGRVGAMGKVSLASTGSNGSFAIDGFFDRTGLQQFTRARLPEEVQVEARTTIRIENSQLTLDPIDLTGRLPGIDLEGVGNYSLSEGPENMVIQIKGEADSVKSIGHVFKKNWPDTNKVYGSTVLRQSKHQDWVLDDFRLEMHEDDLEISAKGSVKLVRAGKIGKFRIFASARQPQFMERITRSAFMHSIVEPIVPLKGQANLYIERKETGPFLFYLREIDIASQVSEGLAVASGQIENIQSPDRKGVLSIMIRDNQGRYSGLLDKEQVEQYPILAESLVADLNLVLDGRHMHVEDMSVSLLTKDARLEATGSLESLNPLITRDLNIDFKVKELSQLNLFNRSKRLKKVPAEGRIKIVNNPDGRVDAQVNLKLKDQILNGKFEVDYAETGKHEVAGYIQTNEFNMENIMDREEKDGPLFSSREFDLSWLDNINLDLELDIGHYRDRIFILEDLSGDFSIRDGALNVVMAGHADNKPLDIWFELWPEQSIWKTKMGVVGDNLHVDALDHNFRSAENLNSTFSIDLDLASAGRSMSEMASRAGGHLNFEVSNVGVKLGESFIFGDLIFGMFNLVLSLQPHEDFDLVECGVVSFKVNDGIASMDKSLALKLKEFTILGSGQIDLASEKVDIVFSSKARKGLGISINTVAKMFKVGGTMRNPELVADAEGLTKTFASVLAGWLTGGATILAQGLFDKEIANSDVCEVARSAHALENS